MTEPGSGPEIEALVAAKYGRWDVAREAFAEMPEDELEALVDRLRKLADLAFSVWVGSS